ncbi:MAG TPA: glycosyltransferase [Candidatus Polarisedimenticolaceae bacterium]
MKAARLDQYAEVVGRDRIALLRRLAARLEGLRLVVVNSTRVGGGVAELLARHVPLFNELGLDARWEVLEGTPEYFATTKRMHNALQGDRLELTPAQREAYLETNRKNAARLELDADVVVIHDPQPAPLIRFAEKRCPWIWRCHIDASKPYRPVWRFLRGFVEPYDASVFSLAPFAQNLPHPQYLIPPSIDPLADKNREISEGEIDRRLAGLGLDRSRPLLVQVSRFDRFKNPVGVIRAWRQVRRTQDCRLVLVGGTADDDPEGAEVLREVREEAGGDPDVHVLSIPPDSDLEINALQRAATVVIQNSTKEGFGLTVTEALWKGRPVVAGAVGGITLQVHDHRTGFLVHSEEGLAFRIRYLLNRPQAAREMGTEGRELVRYRFLLTRHLRDWLTLFLSITGRAP